MLIELTESDKDIAYAQGFIEHWLKIQNAPSQVKEHLDMISNGVKDLRERYYALQEDLNQVRANYSSLTSLSAQYLQIIEKYKEISDANPVERERVPS
jgi:hypothetical protein